VVSRIVVVVDGATAGDPVCVAVVAIVLDVHRLGIVVVILLGL
jgi:hypothetical protein